MRIPFQTAVIAAVTLITWPALAGPRLQLVEHADTDTVIHVGGTVDAIGDLMTFQDPIYDAADKVQLGSDHGYCVRVVLGKSWECFWTLTLVAGQITVEGPYMETGDSLFAITGGTGAYVGAKGSMTVHPRDAQGAAYDLIYEVR